MWKLAWYQTGSSMNKEKLKKSIKKFVPTNEIYTYLSSSIKEFRIGKNFIYKFSTEYKEKVQSSYEELNKELNKIELNNASIAFRKNFSYIHFLEPHRKNYNFIRLDIRTFFHSIQIKDIRKIFKQYIPDDEYIDKNKSQSFLDTFINIVTYKVPNDSNNENFRDKIILPMGFITSPIISNIIFRPLDIQIQELCSRYNIEYTRYADDMLFSSSKDLSYIHSDNFIQAIQIILFQMKFKLNRKKTLKAKHTLSLNGYTIQHSRQLGQIKESKFTPSQKILYARYGKKAIEMIFELRFSNKKTNIVNKIIYMINDEKKSSELILKKLFNFTIEWDFEPEYDEIPEIFYREQLLHKILGYRSYLLSIVKFNEKYHCTQETSINKYLKIIKKLEKISEEYQRKIIVLEKEIRQKKFVTKIKNIDIKGLSFSDWQCNKLQDVGYKTLYDLHKVKEDELIYKIDGVGTIKAQKIIKIISIELEKYK